MNRTPPQLDAHEYLQSPKVCHVSFSLRGRKELRVPCIAKSTDKPNLVVSFTPGHLYLEDIDVTGGCKLHFDGQADITGDIISIEKTIKKSILRRGNIHLATEEQKRKFFRVNTTAPVSAHCPDGGSEEDGHLVGKSLNLSASGMLAAFPVPIRCDSMLQLQISLPGFKEKQPVFCFARLVRTEKAEENNHLAAFHFEDISKKSRDDILSYCLAKDVTELRLLVRVTN